VGLFVIKAAAPPPSRKLTDEAMSFSLVDLSVPLKHWAKLTGDPLKVAFVLRIPGQHCGFVSLLVILDDGGVDQKRWKGELVRGVIIFQQRCCIVIAVLCVRI
jgi:hypothetical protein